MENEKIKILIVDDDSAIRETYTEVFRQDGFEVIESLDGVDGLDAASREKPDVIFTGIIMPRMDGFSLMESLSKNVATAEIPVFVSSHMGRKEDQEKAKEMGAKDFFVQGMITPRQVVEKIRAYFSPRGYALQFDPHALDADKLQDDLDFKKDFKCFECQEQLVINVEISDVVNRKFSTQFVCPKCKRNY